MFSASWYGDTAHYYIHKNKQKKKKNQNSMKITPEVSSFHIQQLVKWLKKKKNNNNKQDAGITKRE